MILPRPFYERPTLEVARDLLGKTFVFGNTRGFITETEAYIGQADPACHAARGRTKRTEVMFGPAGFSYVYLIYGMYHCLNFVTEREGFPAAVLIRGIQLVSPQDEHLNGPGKLCRDIGITRHHNAIDLTQKKDFCVLNNSIYLKYECTQRIGISKGQDKLWRFVARH